MDFDKLIAELLAERDRLDAAIAALAKIAAGGKRRGRPPKWLTAIRPEQDEAAGPPVEPAGTKPKAPKK